MDDLNLILNRTWHLAQRREWCLLDGWTEGWADGWMEWPLWTHNAHYCVKTLRGPPLKALLELQNEPRVPLQPQPSAKYSDLPAAGVRPCLAVLSMLGPLLPPPLAVARARKWPWPGKEMRRSTHARTREKLSLRSLEFLKMRSHGTCGD